MEATNFQSNSYSRLKKFPEKVGQMKRSYSAGTMERERKDYRGGHGGSDRTWRGRRGSSCYYERKGGKEVLEFTYVRPMEEKSRMTGKKKQAIFRNRKC